jgi:protocatechuate 4,5-dioxygenase beta chain
MAARGALSGHVSEVHRNYHIPISNTAAALRVLVLVLVLENRS